MPYYGLSRGDYYRGDYYRGDIWSKIGGAVKKVAKAVVPVLGAAVGGPVGAIAGALAGSGGGGSRTRPTARTIVSQYNPPGIQLPGGITIHPGDVLPGGNPFVERTKNLLPKRYRRMNPLNPKALNRAIRRAQGFEKFAKRTVNALYKTVDGRRVKTFKKRGK